MGAITDDGSRAGVASCLHELKAPRRSGRRPCRLGIGPATRSGRACGRPWRRGRGYPGAVEHAGVPADAVWRYREDVWRLASQLCRHREDAEDVTQSALLKAAEHLEGFRWEASLRTWLHRIATNECRMLRRRKVPLSLDELLEEAATAERQPAEPAAAGPGPEDAAVEAETRRRVVAALGGLPDRYRTAVLLKDGLGLSAEAVAAAMGLTVPAAKSVLHRARAALRESLSVPVRT
jgi:RNA polymerase sigma-70 factor (ECF subfamily)